MNDAKHKYFMAEFNSSKLRLPNIRKIEIRYISNGDKELNSFFQNWVPSNLDLLSVNFYSKNQIGINMGFYIGSISKAIMSATKEIYLSCFEIKETELEHIIRSAFNWERLVLYFSDIHCSRKLDFSGSVRYKLKFLSFAHCGDTKYAERETDWKTNPSSFRNIVEAIAKSRLKDSLQQVDIGWNQTLCKDEVQAMFNELKMPHISVVEKYTTPME